MEHECGEHKKEKNSRRVPETQSCVAALEEWDTEAPDPQMQDKTTDLEARPRRTIICLFGLPENIEGNSAAATWSSS